MSNPAVCFTPKVSHFSFFSTRGGNGNSGDDSPNSTADLWKLSSEDDEVKESLFQFDSGNLEGIDDLNGGLVQNGDEKTDEFRREVEGKDLNAGGTDGLAGAEATSVGSGFEEWAAADDEFKPWDFSEEGKEAAEDVFGIGEAIGGTEVSGFGDEIGVEKSEQEKQLESEAKAMIEVLKGVLFVYSSLNSLNSSDIFCNLY